MIKKLCPVCDQVMQSSNYCRTCHRFVRNPYIRDINYYLNESHPRNDADCSYHNGPTVQQQMMPAGQSRPIGQAGQSRPVGQAGQSRPIGQAGESRPTGQVGQAQMTGTAASWLAAADVIRKGSGTLLSSIADGAAGKNNSLRNPDGEKERI